MIEAVCFFELMLFTLDVLLRAHWFTLFQSEDILAEPSAHYCNSTEVKRPEGCSPPLPGNGINGYVIKVQIPTDPLKYQYFPKYRTIPLSSWESLHCAEV